MPMPMAMPALSDHLTGGDVKSGKQVVVPCRM